MLGFLFICILCLFLIGAPIFVALGMGTTLSIMLEGNFHCSGTAENVCGS